MNIIGILTLVLNSRIFRAVIVLFITVILNKIMSRRIIKLLRKGADKTSTKADENRLDTLFSVLRKVCTAVIYFIGIVYMMQILFNVNPASVIAATGVVGVAVGFASQSLVKDTINGFLILFENQYSIGERVTIDGFCGVVSEINLRATRIKNDEGDIFIIPNSAIVKVINHSRKN